MTWPQAIVTIVQVVLGVMLALAMFTDFWESVLGSRIEVEIEVLPDTLLNELEAILDDMDAMDAYSQTVTNHDVRAWIRDIEHAIKKAKEDLRENSIERQ